MIIFIQLFLLNFKQISLLMKTISSLSSTNICNERNTKNLKFNPFLKKLCICTLLLAYVFRLRAKLHLLQ